MKILIADDAKTTRELLKYYLGLLHVTESEIDEVENGRDAVVECEKNSYDIVFMDINMPILDGISATKFIKKINSEVVVISISADRKTDTINKIIKSGADDYMIKPFNPQLIKQRLTNYIKLVENKKIISTKRSAINIFNTPCYSYFTTFKISSKDDLVIFYDYMHHNYLNKEPQDSNYISTARIAMRTISCISNILIKMSLKCLIILERHDNGLYLTMTHIHSLNKQVIEEIIKKELSDANGLMQYKIELNKLSISAPYINANESHKEEIVLAYNTQEVHQIFDFIEKDDLIEIKDNINDLDSMLELLQYSTLSEADTLQIADVLNKLALCLSGYNETYNISTALRTLSNDILDNKEQFIEKSKTMSTIFINFSHDMQDWEEALFVTGAPNANFMDDTIIANACYIGNLIKPKTETITDEDIDDVFSF